MPRPDEDRKLFELALSKYQQIQERSGLGAAHWCLAGLSNTEAERLEHIQQARKAWDGLPTPWKLYPEIFSADPDQPERS